MGKHERIGFYGEVAKPPSIIDRVRRTFSNAIDTFKNPETGFVEYIVFSLQHDSKVLSYYYLGSYEETHKLDRGTLKLESVAHRLEKQKEKLGISCTIIPYIDSSGSRVIKITK